MDAPSLLSILSGAVIFAGGYAAGWCNNRRVLIRDVLGTLASVRDETENRQFAGHGDIGYGPGKVYREAIARARERRRP